MRQRRRDWTGLAVSAAGTYAAGGIGALVTLPRLEKWYRTLDKPGWTPPDAVFGPVWNTLYGAQAVAAWLVWRSDSPGRAQALRWYGVQVGLNTGWTLLFFGLRRPVWAQLEIVALWLAIVVTTREFSRSSRVAAGLMVPYLSWVSFAAVLNYSIWRRNYSGQSRART